MRRTLRDSHPVIAINESDSVYIDCIVTGSPRPIVRWFSLDKSYDAHLHTTQRVERVDIRLVFDKVTRDDAGAYVCRATNGDEEAERTIDLVVQCEFSLDRVEFI